MIDGLHVRLRGLRLEDVPEIMRHWNRLELRNYLALMTPHSQEDEEKFIKNTWEGFRKLTRFPFGIETLKENLLIGVTELADIEWLNRHAQVGISIFNEKFQGKGYGTEALQLLLFYGFNILNLHSVYLRVFEYNKRAIRSYVKVGFKEVGRLRKARFLHGQYHDVVLMDILSTEFQLPPELEKHLHEKYQTF